MSAWQPIETAPKNKAVLLTDGLNVWRDLFWSAESIWPVAAEHELTPTHWMPLPEPPEAHQ